MRKKVKEFKFLKKQIENLTSSFGLGDEKKCVCVIQELFSGLQKVPKNVRDPVKGNRQGVWEFENIDRFNSEFKNG
jgi:hypothetical protein